MAKQYEKSWIAVDAVIFTIVDSKLMCYLHTREREPFLGKKELLGGLLLPKETTEETLARKLKQTIGETSIYFRQFRVFSKVDRDPRERAVSIGYIALVGHNKMANPQDWFEYGKLTDLAFDHLEIAREAYSYLQHNLNALIAKQFMPKYFPLNDLQRVYEIIENKKYDNRNFRKKMLLTGTVKETKRIEKQVSHRPAKMYTFK